MLTTDHQLKKKLFYSLLRIRRIEEKIVSLYPEQEMRCPVHFSIGQEAIAVGVCHALEKQDCVLSGHRSHAHYLAKGGCLQSMLAELYGKEAGCSLGRGGSMHLVDHSVNFIGATPIVGNTIPIAVGVAFAKKMQKSSEVTVVFFGEGATETGYFYESLQFAVLHQLPVIFVCENNHYAVATPLHERRTDRQQITNIVRGFGVNAIQEDGQDVIQVHNAFLSILDEIKNKEQKPCFVEFRTHSFLEHCGPNSEKNKNSLTPEKSSFLEDCDPILLFKKQLEGHLSPEEMQCIEQKIDQEINEAVHFAKTAPFPSQNTLFNHIFKTGESY